MRYENNFVKLDEILKSLFSTSKTVPVDLINGVIDENMKFDRSRYFCRK